MKWLEDNKVDGLPSDRNPLSELKFGFRSVRVVVVVFLFCVCCFPSFCVIMFFVYCVFQLHFMSFVKRR